MFREKVRELVDLVGSQEKVAALIGVTQAAVSAWVMGGAARPPAERAVRQAVADFDIRVDWFGIWLRAGCRGNLGARGSVMIRIDQFVDTRKVGSEVLVVALRDRGKFPRDLAVRWLGWSTAGSGEYLIAWRALDGEDAGVIREIAYFDGLAVSRHNVVGQLLAGL
jgi:transcriptional regulator with XRE-family HTH domain